MSKPSEINPPTPAERQDALRILAIPIDGAWQCSKCGYWYEGLSGAAVCPFGVCPCCGYKMIFYQKPEEVEAIR